jgi:hypothetical protein
MIVLLMNYDVEWAIVGEATIKFQGLDAAFGNRLTRTAGSLSGTYKLGF